MGERQQAYHPPGLLLLLDAAQTWPSGPAGSAGSGSVWGPMWAASSTPPPTLSAVDEETDAGHVLYQLKDQFRKTLQKPLEKPDEMQCFDTQRKAPQGGCFLAASQ